MAAGKLEQLPHECCACRNSRSSMQVVHEAVKMCVWYVGQGMNGLCSCLKINKNNILNTRGLKVAKHLFSDSCDISLPVVL